jgi:prepilin-type N-terminal cleavage/methylation domain-containing protein
MPKRMRYTLINAETAGHFRKRGFSLLEVILALVTLSIVALGAGIGLQSITRGSDQVEWRLWFSNQLSSSVESLRDTAYASLVTGTKASDADRNGHTYPISWTVLEIDPASPTLVTAKANSGLKQLVVTLNGQTVSTWISQ